MILATLPLTKGPKHQLGAAAATGFLQKRRNVPLNGPAAQRQTAGDGSIAGSLKHEGEHPFLGWGDVDGSKQMGHGGRMGIKCSQPHLRIKGGLYR